MHTLQKIEAEILNGNINGALPALENILSQSPGNARAWFLKGKCLWKSGKRTEAISAYNHACAIDPQSPAAIALEQARNIENFFNPQLLNP